MDHVTEREALVIALDRARDELREYRIVYGLPVSAGFAAPDYVRKGERALVAKVAALVDELNFYNGGRE